jgi:predicted S18 family serine protease
MKRILALALVAALLAVPAVAELGGQTVSATAGSQTITVTGETLTIVNDGSNEVYVRVFHTGETPAAATTSHREIKSGEGFSFTKSMGITAVSIVCATGETATVRLFYW